MKPAFTKVKYNGKQVELLWTEIRPRGDDSKKKDTIEHPLVSDDLPHPDFLDAMQHLLPEVLDLLELEPEYGKTMRVIGLSLNYEESDRMGVVITCLKDLAETNAPLVLNTPHLREESDEDPPEAISMPGHWIDLIEDIKSQARAYIDGKRAQGDLFAPDARAGIESITISHIERGKVKNSVTLTAEDR